MTKFNGYLLKFGVKDSMGYTFDANGVYEYSEKIPLYYSNAINPINLIGYAEIERRDDGLYCKSVLNEDTQNGRLMKELAEKETLYFGGAYYKLNPSQMKNKHIEKACLRYVFITLSDVYGDKKLLKLSVEK